MRLRERPRTSIALPLPAPLPPMRDALARRAAIFGPFDADPAPVAPRGPLARLSGMVDLLLPRGTR